MECPPVGVEEPQGLGEVEELRNQAAAAVHLNLLEAVVVEMKVFVQKRYQSQPYCYPPP